MSHKKVIGFLEIGSGWGSFAFYLNSKFPDITIDTLTISKEQFDFVQKKSYKKTTGKNKCHL